MDSPLNLAHQQGRRADALVRSGKFDDAVDCHKRAAEYLLEAMQLTSSEHALESLRLQHKHHLHQQELILEKRIRIERAHNAQKSSENRTNQSCQTDDLDTIDGDLDPNHFSEASLYHTMTHTDTLLAFLKDSQESSSPKTSAPRVTFNKCPRDETAVIEELQAHNEHLQKHVKRLLRDLDTVRRENEQLQTQLRERETLKHVMSEPVFSPDHFTPFDLPPLEMPTLSLDMLQEGLQSDDALIEK
ncbi:nuclear receptor-binding factor 2-like [Haliotis rufescens]|uniref:nuclear receptor-binding factor 2-like n=1 Tax=Haliotis rufescens TaxID=6454 RepID=UPI001EAFF223|nr:nuclear receptor-binding factor 2-like [Haliotis rufescens]